MFLIWAIMGGFLRSMIYSVFCSEQTYLWPPFFSHFLLCNFLSVMLRPMYEAPINTAQDIIEKDYTLFGNVGKKRQHFLEKYENPVWAKINRRTRTLYRSPEKLSKQGLPSTVWGNIKNWIKDEFYMCTYLRRLFFLKIMKSFGKNILIFMKRAGEIKINQEVNNWSLSFMNILQSSLPYRISCMDIPRDFCWYNLALVQVTTKKL